MLFGTGVVASNVPNASHIVKPTNQTTNIRVIQSPCYFILKCFRSQSLARYWRSQPASNNRIANESRIYGWTSILSNSLCCSGLIMALSLNTKKLIIRIVLFLIYLLVGAAIFQAIELPNEKRERDNDQFETLKENFTNKYNISNDDMKEFLEKLKKALELGYDLQSAEYPTRYQWHFMNAFFFAGNVVTTIGESD